MPACARCGQDNPDIARFCLACGAALERGADRAPEERRLVSVLFCDLVGFTERSDGADPEDVKETLRPYHALLKHEVETFGGTLDKFVGDAGLGVWGAPTAHEDDPERAVRAALHILGGIEELNRRHPAVPLAVRIAVNTGEAVVSFGTGPQIGESVTGDVVNTASRLQSVAGSGGVVVGEPTYLATRERFRFREREAVTVKGKSEPLSVWEVLGATRAQGATPTRSHGAPFVGRQAERRGLEDALHRVVVEASPRLVTVVAEPGVGKSRLVAEAEAAAGDLPDPAVWRKGRCLPYGEGVTFWALGEIVKTEAAILESDDPGPREAKLASCLRGLIGDASERAWLQARLAPLAGVERGVPVDREESFAAWRRFFELLATRTPLVAVIEDVQWADPAVLDFLVGLVERVAGVRLLVVATARPEFAEQHPGWDAGLRNATTISLSPLSEDETATLIAGLLDRAPLPAEARALLVERAGGNPLYAEEFARMLLDRGLLNEEGRPGADLGAIAFPDSVRALIAARLDTLSTGPRTLLQDASVIGLVFWTGAVAHLAGRDESSVLADLEELAGREFVRRAEASTVEGEAEYAFWHGLVRDVAYAQIPRAARATRHRAAAQWLERMAGDRTAAVSEILAYHATEALDLMWATGDTTGLGELEDAARRYLMMAGAYALGLDVTKAEAHLRRALRLTPAGHAEHARLQGRLAEVAFHAGRLEESEGLYTDAIRGLRAGGLASEAADAAVRLSVVVEYRGDTGRGRALLNEAIETLEGIPPGPELARALAESAGTMLIAGRYQEVITVADRAIELAREVGEGEAEVRASNFRGYARVVLGDPDGVAELRESLEGSLALGLGRATAVAYSNLGSALLLAEGARPTLECLREGVAFAERRGLREMTGFLRNSMLSPLVAMGEWDEVLRMGALVAEEARQEGAMYDEVFAEVDLAYVRVHREGGPASPFAEELLARARAIGDAPLLVSALVIAGLGRLASGKLEGAAALTREALELTQADVMAIRGEQLPDLVRIAAAAGDLDLAARLIEGVDGLRLPRYRYAVLTARAIVSEGHGRAEEALRGHEQAAVRWREFGHALDEGHGHLGAGRCLMVIGRPGESGDRLAAARAIFARLGAAPLVAEVDALV